MVTSAAKQAVSQILTEDILSLGEARREIHSLTRRRPDIAFHLDRAGHRGIFEPTSQVSWLAEGRQLEIKFIL